MYWVRLTNHLEKMEEKRHCSELNAEQQQVMNALWSGSNQFFTGPAGTGKSFVIKYMVDELTEQKKQFAITSSTSSSAANIGGVTVHSWAGIGLGDAPVEELIRKIRVIPVLRQRWRTIEFWIMDEISILDKDIFTKLDKIGRAVRGKPHTPFGGIKMVICGDYFQLPPISEEYAFESPSWAETVNHTIILKEIHRQTESILIDGLNEMRMGRVSEAFIQAVTKDKDEFYKLGNGVLPSRLLSKNRDVDEINEQELARLTSEKFTFKTKSPQSLDKLFTVPSEITLAVGAQVILVKKADGYVNGTRGVITEIQGYGTTNPRIWVKGKDGKSHLVVQKLFEAREQGKVVATRLAFPIRLAWCISIHRSQGQSIDYLDVNLQGVFSPAQSYVAVSRATCLSGLRVTGLCSKVVYCDPKVVAFYASLEQ